MALWKPLNNSWKTTRRAVSRFRGMTGPERRLLWEAFWLLACLKAGLRVLPFQAVRGALSCLTVPTAVAAQSGDGGACRPDALTRRIAWSVNAAAGRLSATCLPRALAVHVLMARRGLPSDLRIGVCRAPGAALEAHAWVEDASGVLIGGLPDLSRFVPLPALEARTT